MTRWTDDRGFVGGFEVLPFGFLVFLAGTLLIVNAWAVFDCHLAASAAAREAVRAFVESAGPDAVAIEEAELAAQDALTGQGKDAARMTLSWEGARLERCQLVSVTVAYDVPTIAIPFIGSFGGGVIRTTSKHSEIVDPFRRGLAVDGFDPEACGA
jgi:hypothetical protein